MAEPEAELTFSIPREGFRGVRWGTRQRDVPWQWSDQGFPAPCFLRRDEQWEVFGIRASHLTYTFRNSLLYGVRIDYEGREQGQRALAALKQTYPPAEKLGATRPERAWRTAETAVWVCCPTAKDGAGTIYLWGRHRTFGDDAPAPTYLARPPALNSVPGPFVPRHYVCYRASGPITVDGHLNEKAWQDAEWSQPFQDHQAPYAPEPWKTTRFKMLYDDTNLYFAAQLQEENVWGTLHKRDCVIYYDNDFEIFLDATADGVGYYEFEINPLNTAWDMFHETDYHRASALHSDYDVTGLRHVVQVQGTLNYHYDEDEGWTVEVSWPLASLRERNRRVSLPVRRGDTWRLNFSRVQYLHIYDHLFPAMVPKSPCEDWIWQSTDTGDLHNPEMWGKVIFSDQVAGTVKDQELERGFPVRRAPRPPRARTPEMVWLPPCTFTMGPDPTDALRSPAHQVEVGGFWMDPYPVRVAEFAAFLNAGDHHQHYNTWMRIPERCGIVREGDQYRVVAGREQYPVVYVGYEAAAAYAAFYGKALPSEAQWERAARGPEGRYYPWGNQPLSPQRANYDFHYGGTTPVGSFPQGATPEGIFDLVGNVKEYTTSLFESYPGGEPMIYLGMREPFIHPHTVFRVVRGGAWTKQAGCMAAAYRDAHGSLNLGFRCIRLP
ncbi:MAG: SUMF1/EgtB/PvdO family nonheme iron enzyme [Candidatus Latescibacteria bacterium]|nr:SUMF1/EgtB/PvdO family nonheme iron enzyme [Candidatus Latescibacterota bacterium]